MASVAGAHAGCVVVGATADEWPHGSKHFRLGDAEAVATAGRPRGVPLPPVSSGSSITPCAPARRFSSREALIEVRHAL